MSNLSRKVLYNSRPGVADNYVDSTFLINMKKNLYVKEYNLVETVIEAGSIHHQFCWISIFVFIYFAMSLDIVRVSHLALALLAIIFGAHFTIFVIDRSIDNLWLQIRIGSIVLVFNLILCPVLYSLTTSISTDTIYAITMFLLIASWACHTYSSADSINGDIELNPLSVNAGVMASLCLASRLPSLWHSFVMVNSAMAIFGLQPNFTCKVKKQFYPFFQISMTIILSLICCLCIYFWVSLFVTCCFIVLTVGINIVCPLIFLRMQRLKNNIHGPWDEAIPK